MSAPKTKITVGISSCLLGESVRYDGGHRENLLIKNELGKVFNFIPFCPEVAIGLGVPRNTLQLVNRGNNIRCLGVEDENIDVTDPLIRYANTQKGHHAQLSGYIFKKGSPSCGIKNVKTFNIGNKDPEAFIATGIGIYAEQVKLNNPLLPVTDENDLSDALLRESFIQRVIFLHNWQQLLSESLTINKLRIFHTQHVLTHMNQDNSESLNKLLEGLDMNNIEEISTKYILSAMKILS